MHWQDILRGRLSLALSKRSSFTFKRRIPDLERNFASVEEFGLYLHVPFCRRICPYCPYNKELFHPEIAGKYARAVKKEIDLYADLMAGRPVTSIYIGGGTPTTMLGCGLEDVLAHLHRKLNVQASIHMESHPNDLAKENLDAITALGVEHLSLGVESLHDHHLRTLERPYTVRQVVAAIERATARGFRCVNVDVMFALPGQTLSELDEEAKWLVELGVGQVAAYPIFPFPYTRWAGMASASRSRPPGLFQKRQMLAVFERVLYAASFERTSVWAFTRSQVPKYCSVTIPLYVGLGAGAGSYLRDVFYLNTFKAGDYVSTLAGGSLPISLSLELTEAMQMAGWLYWRIYETRFRKRDFARRFGRDFDRVYGRYVRLASFLGLLADGGDEVVLNDSGAYWLHAIQDLFSLAYVGRLWQSSMQEPWPEEVLLH